MGKHAPASDAPQPGSRTAENEALYLLETHCGAIERLVARSGAEETLNLDAKKSYLDPETTITRFAKYRMKSADKSAPESAK